MFLPIMIISFLVQIYSVDYLRDDPHKIRFFSYLSLFTLNMLLLVTADNLFLIFLGWEGVGIVSYLLINFWFTNSLANIAALKAFFINRFGDMFLLLGI